MDYQILSRAEIELLNQIDREETVENVYYYCDGELVLKEEHWDVPDWSKAEKERRIGVLQKIYDEGATFIGAFDDFALVGMGLLIHQPLTTGANRLNLNGLWVSHEYREQGVGRMLVRLIEQEARERGAKAVYISSAPGENTVRFYMCLGYKLTGEIDPVLFAEEPEDIHMERLI